MEVGQRIFYNTINGKPIFSLGECCGDVKPYENMEVKYIDLPYGDETLDNVENFHIKNEKIVIDKYREHIETKEEKLEKELLDVKAELVDLKYKELIENKERMAN